MLLKEIMTPKVEAIRANTLIVDVAKRMRELDVGAFPVVASDGVHGIVTDRDITIRGVAAGMDPTKAPVSDVMTAQVLAMSAETPVSEAAQAMQQQQIRRLLVTDEQNNVIGIVSLGDLAVRGGEKLGGEALQKISDPTQPDRPSPANA